MTLEKASMEAVDVQQARLEQGAAEAPGANTPETGTRRLLAVLAALVALSTITGILARDYWQERRERAAVNYRAGEKHKASKDYERAIEHYRMALAFAPANVDYRLALAVALFDYGRSEEAELRLREVLDRDPTNGVANLFLARIGARRGDQASATLYYHRAIYGLWPENPRLSRLEARWELVELLASAGDKKQLLAELLPLMDEGPAEAEARKRIARYFVLAGAPSDAATIYREVAKRDRKDGEAWAGLGEVEFLEGRFPEAQAAYREAIRANPKDLDSQKQLTVTTEILQLDPSLLRLSFAERYRRAYRLVELALGAWDGCLAARQLEIGENDPVRPAVEEARKVVKAGRKRRPEPESVETHINLAERLWNARATICGSAGTGEEALAHVLARLAR